MGTWVCFKIFINIPIPALRFLTHKWSRVVYSFPNLISLFKDSHRHIKPMIIELKKYYFHILDKRSQLLDASLLSHLHHMVV